MSCEGNVTNNKSIYSDYFLLCGHINNILGVNSVPARQLHRLNIQTCFDHFYNYYWLTLYKAIFILLSYIHDIRIEQINSTPTVNSTELDNDGIYVG